MLLKIVGLGVNTAAFELLLLPTINDRHAWLLTKNVEVFGLLNTGLIFTEVITSLSLQPVSRAAGQLQCVTSKSSSALNVFLVYLCLVSLNLLSICIACSVMFQLSGLLFDSFCSFQHSSGGIFWTIFEAA